MIVLLGLLCVLVLVALVTAFVRKVADQVAERAASAYVAAAMAELGHYVRTTRALFRSTRGASLGVLLGRGRRDDDARNRIFELQLPDSSINSIIDRLDSGSGQHVADALALVGVGGRAANAVQRAANEVGGARIVAARVVCATQPVEQIEWSAGTTSHQAAAAVEWVNGLFSAGKIKRAVFLICPPAFESSEAAASVVRSWSDLDLAVQFVIELPKTPHSWPPRVAISTRLPRFVFRRALRREGTTVLAENKQHGTFTLDASAAARLLCDATGVGRSGAAHGSDLDWRWWEAQLSLMRTSPGDVTPITESEDARLRAAAASLLESWEVVARTDAQSRQPGRRLALDVGVAHRFISISAPTAGVPARDESDVGPPDQISYPPLLDASSLSADVELLVAREGRVWVEQGPEWLEDALRLAAAPSQTPTTRAWGSLLLSLNSALRLNRPNTDLLVGDHLSNAEAVGSGFALLFRMEVAEFARLSNDLDVSTALLNAEAPNLSEQQTPASPSDAYGAGTARFVAANMLRRGGRYFEARALIAEAVSILDPTVPSHAVELLHCRYADSVCQAVTGSAFVQDVADALGIDATFAQALRTMSNSHAAWFVRDYSRAQEFAAIAKESFTRSGYPRYAARASALQVLVSDWAHLRAGGDPAEVRDAKVSRLLRPQQTEAVSDLALLRPSRVLSLLQFVRVFGTNNDEACPVLLPRLMFRADDGTFEYGQIEEASSLSDAEMRLRSALGVPPSAPFPLMAD